MSGQYILRAMIENIFFFVPSFNVYLSGANWTRIPLKTCLTLTVMSRALVSKHKYYRFHLFVGFTLSLAKQPEQFIDIDSIKKKKKNTWCLCWGEDVIFGHTSHLKYMSGVLCHVSQPICSYEGWPTVSVCLGLSQCVSVVQVSLLPETFSRQKHPLLDIKWYNYSIHVGYAKETKEKKYHSQENICQSTRIPHMWSLQLPREKSSIPILHIILSKQRASV